MLFGARSRGPSSRTSGTPRRSQWKNFAPGDLTFAVVDFRADVFRDAVRGLEHLRLLFVLAINRHQHRLDRRDFRRQHQSLVVGMAHDQAADQAAC